MAEAPILNGPSFRPDGFSSYRSIRSFLKHEDYPGKVVRPERERIIFGENRFLQGVTMLQELSQSPYGITIPNFTLARTNFCDTRKPNMAQIVDEIDGVHVTSYEFNLLEYPSAVPEVDRTISGLLQYYSDKYMQGETVLVDICRWKQYMYGRGQGDEAPRLYLIDVGPIINSHSGRFSARNSNAKLMLEPLNMLRYLEERFGELPLPLTRAALQTNIEVFSALPHAEEVLLPAALSVSSAF